MAIAELTSQRSINGGAASTSVVFAYPVTPTEGNLLIACWSYRLSGTTITATPSGWTNIEQRNGDINTVISWKIAGASEATSHTWTISASVKSAGSGTEYSGVSATPADNNASSSGSSTSFASGTTATTAQADELWVAAAGCNTNATFSSYTNSFASFGSSSSTGGPTSSRNTAEGVAKIVTATGTASTAATVSASVAWAGVVATFKASTGSPITVTPGTASLTTATFAPMVAVGVGSAADTFERTVVDGWGTSDLGGAWTGTTADFDVASGEGQIVTPVSSNRNAFLNSVQATGDLDVSVDWGYSEPFGGSEVFGWVAVRRQERDLTSTGNLYQIRWQIAISGALQILHFRYLATVRTTLGTNYTSALTFDNTKRYRLRFLVETAAGVVRIRSKIWEVGTSEPASWQKDDSDTPGNAYLEGTSPGTVSVRTQTAASNFGTFYYDNLSVAAPVSGTTVTPGVASLTTAAFAPTVTATDHKLVTPGVAALSLSAFAPAVIASDNQSVTPSTASLTTATFAPSVTTTAHQTVTPTTASLSTTAFAPTVTATANQGVTPGTASLTLATFAPTATGGAGTTVTPGTASLALSTLAPSVTASDHKTVTPTTASLTTARFAPTASVTNHQSVTPTTASLTLSAFAPNVTAGAGLTLVPTTASLSTSTFAPTISVTSHQVVTPGVATLSTTAFAPTVTAADPKTVTPATANLALVGLIPNVLAPVTVTPATPALSLAAFAPVVSATEHQTVTVGPAALTLATFAPSVTATDPQVVTVGAAVLSVTSYAPVVSDGSGTLATPSVTALVILTFAPSLYVTGSQSQMPAARFDPRPASWRSSGGAVDDFRVPR